MKSIILGLLAVIILGLISACQSEPVCPEGSITYVTDPSLMPPPAAHPIPATEEAPIAVEIGGKMLEVDRMIEGSLCNDTLSGIVYVGCNISIVDWSGEKNPVFLDDCNFKVEPDTVIYVASHNDTPYYNGCSCHTGISNP